jgi:hypothetical protein
MKTLSVERNNPSLAALVEMIADGTIIITRGNRPICAIMPLNEEDLQTWELGENPEFLALMQHSWQRLDTEGGVSLAEARRRLLAEQPESG